MKLKSIVLAVAVLAVLSLGVWFLQRPAPPAGTDARVGQSLAPAGALAGAAQVRLADQGRVVTLAKAGDGAWTVTSFHDFPADFAKLAHFIDELGTAKVQRLVTSSAERIARLEFKDAQVALLDGAGKELWSVHLGKNAESGHGRFVRFGTEEKAYLTNFSGWLDTESKNWANAELLKLSPDTVARLKIPLDDGETVTVTRAKKEDPWTAEKTPAGEKLKADRIAALLPILTDIRFTAVSELTDPALVAAKAHARTIEFSTFDGKTVTVTLARKPEEKRPKSPAADAKAGSATPATKEGDQGLPAKPAEPPAPEFDTIPAGPVFVIIADGDAAAPVNALMAKFAFQVLDYGFDALPQKSGDLFETTAPAPATPVAPGPPIPAPPDGPKTP